MIELPTSPTPVLSQNPKKLLIYSNPKGGKTTILAGLKDALIVDLEGGTRYVEAMTIQAPDIKTVHELTKTLAKGHNYKYICLDPITRLEDIVLPYAKQLYVKTPQGKNFDGDNVLHLPNGGGYLFLRQAFFAVLNAFSRVTDHLVITGHVRDKMIEKNGKEVTHSEVDLTGKIRSILCADVDAIAYLDRRGPDGFFRFATSEDVICGARPMHLLNREIHISHLEDDGSVTTYWDEIFIPETKEGKAKAAAKQKANPVAKEPKGAVTFV